MADKELVELLRKGSAFWNAWQRNEKAADEEFSADLSGADLGDADLRRVDLSGADLSNAWLNHADLSDANLAKANLNGASLSDADLNGTDLSGADLRKADLIGAKLMFAKLSTADLGGTKVINAILGYTFLVDVDLADVIGLETCGHIGPSYVDFGTLRESGPLPLVFLQGIGLPDSLIDNLPLLLGQAIDYYSCFISYSAKDEEFVRRLHANLQKTGVRCWFAPHDLPIGGKILDEIDAAIRLRDKLLLVLSENSIKSDWVEDEVKTAFEEERRRGQTVLFPIRLDDSFFETKEAWASKLRMDRNIGDFRTWKDHDRYQESLQRVLRDLKNAER